jgi:hypothetical protein
VNRTASSALVLLASVVVFSCTTVVHPPPAPRVPEVVILLTHGKSSSLVLPREERGSARWAYGDWRYYALGETGVYATVAAVLWPTPSALGRQLIDQPTDDAQRLVERLGIGIDRVFLISVEREEVDRLAAHLTEVFESQAGTAVHNPEARLEFVRHPEPYTLWSSSNRRVAQWLEALGCRVDGFALLSRWRVEPPGHH